MPRNASSDHKRRSAFPWSRDYIILVIFAIIIVCLFGRLVFIQVIEAPVYAEMAATAHTYDVTIPARRGTIYDRNGEVLASNVEATTIYANPKEIGDPIILAQTLQKVLGESYDMTYQDYYALLTKTNTSFVYIHRKADKELAAKLKEELERAGIKGIHYLEDTKRVYTYGDTGAQVVGAVDIDGHGIAGLELYYNELLGGRDGQMSIERGLYDIPIADAAIAKTDAVDGDDIITSIDIKLEEKCEQRLLEAMKQYKAENGSITVMDASTGEIYAACSLQGVKDEKTNKTEYSYEVGKLRAVTDAYEPGSTFKALTAACVLANSDTELTTMFTVPPSLDVYDATITDSHEHGVLQLDFKGVIAESSNIGTVLASRAVTNEQLYETYKGFGIGQATDTDFPGVNPGSLEAPSDWDGVQAANITFGQGLMTSGLQILRAYGAIEQNGVARVPHFLTEVPQNAEKQKELTAGFGETVKMADPDICKQVAEMLHAVTTDGTGTTAQIPGFKVAGKTGTAEVANNNGKYYANKVIVSFAGWLYGSSSDLVCLITLQHNNPYSDGGTVCGPIFADIMSFAADRYHIAPKAD